MTDQESALSQDFPKNRKVTMLPDQRKVYREWLEAWRKLKGGNDDVES